MARKKAKKRTKRRGPTYRNRETCRLMPLKIPRNARITGVDMSPDEPGDECERLFFNPPSEYE